MSENEKPIFNPFGSDEWVNVPLAQSLKDYDDGLEAVANRNGVTFDRDKASPNGPVHVDDTGWPLYTKAAVMAEFDHERGVPPPVFVPWSEFPIGNDPQTRHSPSIPAECPPNGSFSHAITRDGITPNPAIRDCVDCGTPFFSRSTGNVVCSICRADSTAEFDQGEL